MIAARPGTALRELLAGPHRMAALGAQPFVNARWSVAMRLSRIIEHCQIVDRIGPPFCLGAGEYVEIIQFHLRDEPCRFMIDRPRWLQCDGLLTASLWVGADRVVAISFCLSGPDDDRTVFVGGIQGRRHASAVAQNRSLTKNAHGVRPTELAFDLFRALLPTLGAKRLRCVANADRYQKTKRALMTIPADDRVLLDYDEIWLGRGGDLGADGFFDVPARRVERNIEDIPSKKRSMYRQRYTLLQQLDENVNVALQSSLPVMRHSLAAD